MKARKTFIIVILGVAVLVIGSFFLVSKKGETYAILNSLKLIPQPEQFTELYFINTSALPQAIIPGKATFFAFAIHNMEGSTTTYPYEVYFNYPNGSRLDMDKGNVVLANNASTTVTISYIFPSSTLMGEVVVDLPSLNNQSIDFLLPNYNQ